MENEYDLTTILDFDYFVIQNEIIPFFARYH